MEKLLSLQKKYGFSIVEDACKAMFCKAGRCYLGTIGEMGCFSLGLISLLSIGYGGFIVTNDDSLAEKCRLIRDHGLVRDPEEYLYQGFNFKVSDLLLAIGKGQFERIEEKKEHLLKVYQRYEEGLAGCPHVKLLPIDYASGLIPLCVDLISPSRSELKSYLKVKGIEISNFHIPVHKAKYLGDYNPRSFPNSTRFSKQGFMPPCGPNQSLDKVDKVIETILHYK
jgi:perosamine synthetase